MSRDDRGQHVARRPRATSRGTTAGNISRDDRGFEYAHDYDNRLSGVTWIGTGGPATVGEFAYDALGRMISGYTRFDTDVNGETETRVMFHDGSNVALEYDSSQTTLLRYSIHGKSYIDERAVMHDAADDVDYYYTLKDLYTVDALVNNRGHEVERVTYDAYGMPVMRAIRTTDVDYNGTVNAIDLGLVQAATDPCTDGPRYDIDGNGTINATDQGLVQSSYGSAIATLYTSGLGNAYFFTGRRMHHFDSNLIDLGPAPNTAIQYNRARHYDPEHGRWLQRDPLEYHEGAHLYEYVQSRAATLVDPSGLQGVLEAVEEWTRCGPWRFGGFTRLRRWERMSDSGWGPWKVTAGGFGPGFGFFSITLASIWTSQRTFVDDAICEYQRCRRCDRMRSCSSYGGSAMPTKRWVEKQIREASCGSSVVKCLVSSIGFGGSPPSVPPGTGTMHCMTTITVDPDDVIRSTRGLRKNCR